MLRAAGIEPLARVSGVDEDAVAAALTEPTPAELVTALAVAKAEAVLPQLAEDAPGEELVVVGCDSMLSIHGEVVGKPHDPEIAAKRWRGMAGSSGELLTGHTALRVRDGEVLSRAQAHRTTVVRFAEPSEAEIEDYIGTGEPLHVAGGFTLDGLGGWFVEGVDGDPSSVIGISLPLTRQLLAQLDVRVTDLWTR